MKQMNSRDFLKNILKFSLSSIISAVVAALVLPVVSRLYPPAEYGYISNFQTIGNLLMGIVFFGLDSAYIRHFYEPPENASRNGLFVFSLCMGVCVTVVLFFSILAIAPQRISSFLFNDHGIIGFILLGVYVLGLVFFRVLNINMRFTENARAYNLQQVSFILGNKILIIIATVFSTKYIYSVAVMTGAVLAIVVVSLYFQRNFFSDVHINKSAGIEMLRFAIPVMPAAIIVLLNNSVAKLILGGFGLRDEVGIFAIAISVANIFSVIPTGFSIYWGSFMYQNYDNEHEKIKRVQDVVLLLSIVLVIGIILLQDVLYLFLGKDYCMSQPYFMLVMLTPITSLLGETTGYGINLAKKTKYTLYISCLSCISNITLCYILIPHMGAYGAAVGVAVSATINFVMRTCISQRYYQSILNDIRTGGGCMILWGLCIGNTYLCEHIFMRCIVCVGVAGIICILYQESIQMIKNSFIKWSKKYRRSFIK